MREHQKNAFAVARFLETSPHVIEVMYPGLPSHPQHELARRQCRGYSGMVSFRIKGTLENAKKFLESLKVRRGVSSCYVLCACIHVDVID